MTSSTVHALATASGPAALPRKNGELVFEAPWQSRAFGLAIALHDAGAIDFEEFRERLIAEIAAHELEHGTDGDGGRYYEHWLDALQHVLGEQQLWRLRRSASAPARSRTPGRTTMTISTSTVMSTPTPASTGSRGRSRDDHCGECLDGGADRRPDIRRSGRHGSCPTSPCSPAWAS